MNVSDVVKRYGSGGLLLITWFVSIIPSHLIRNAIYFLLGLKMKRNATIYSRVEIRAPWKIIIGENSIVGHYCLLDGRRGIEIGRNVNLSSGVWIWTLQHDPMSPDFSTKGGSVIIHDYAWLGARSMVLPGCTIGEGAVVAAGAVVTRSVEPFTIVGGIPAHKIGDRNRDLKYNLKFRLPFV
jgi:acetyltransferase-like isoleucine patch superfamily enzyme